MVIFNNKLLINLLMALKLIMVLANSFLCAKFLLEKLFVIFSDLFIVRFIILNSILKLFIHSLA